MPKYPKAKPFDFVHEFVKLRKKVDNLATQRLTGTIGVGSNFLITEDGMFLYSGFPATGNLILSFSAAPNGGVDDFGNSYPIGLGIGSGLLGLLEMQQLVVQPGGIFVDGNQGSTFVNFSTPGINSWIAPTGVTSVQVFCWGPGAAGGNGVSSGYGGGGGGGGELAWENSVAVTPGTTYFPFVGPIGQATTFAGDSLTVTGNPGQPGNNGTSTGPGLGGLGGSGSPNTFHHNGGTGGDGGPGAFSGGGGGGSAAAASQAGNAGADGDATGDGGAGGPQIGGLFGDRKSVV